MPDNDELIVEQWDIDKLIPYARNPRKNDEQVGRMVSAIKEFGFRIPVVAKSDGTIVDGHLRYKAAKKLGLKTIPVAIADDLSEAQIKAFRILANKSANWAEWDDDLLKLELQELQEVNFDLELTGFDLDELENLINDSPAQENEKASNPTLADRYMFAPFSVLNAREGDWQNRKNEWLDMGIQSELGRGGICLNSQKLAPSSGLAANFENKKALANPGGSPRPACDYSKSKARGDGHGRAFQ